MRLFNILLFAAALILAACQKPSKQELPIGEWLCELQLNDSTILPFQMKVIEKNDTLTAWYMNGKERISSLPAVRKGDSFFFEHSVFNTSLVVWPVEGNWIGYFEDQEKRDIYRIPLAMKPYKGMRFGKEHVPTSMVEGLWNVIFGDSSNGSFPATGSFQNHPKELRGSFLTETGDYRFLSGISNENKILLSGFDGLHAFLVKAEIDGDSITGSFWSGKHYFRNFFGKRSDSSFLRDPFNLTEITSVENNFPLPFYTSSIDSAYLPSIIDRGPAIIQIMGTWCPNCMDESLYLNELYERYHNKGLKIIGLAFEKGNSAEQAFHKINKAKTALGLNYPIYYGGEPNKDLVLDYFPFLSDMKSYPTTIYLNKSLKPVKVHTGFNGPGTGTFFDSFKKENESIINNLLEEL